MFNNKFFYAEVKFFLVDLGHIYQCPEEDPDMYVKRFYDKTLDCCDPMEGRLLVHMFLHSRLEEYRMFLESLSFSSFSKLMEASRYSNDSVRKALQLSSTSWSNPKTASRKKSIVATIKEGEGFRPFDSKNRHIREEGPGSCPFHCDPKKVANLLTDRLEVELSPCGKYIVFPLPKTKRSRSTILTIRRGVIPSRNAFHLERSSKRSVDRVNCYFRRVDHSISKICHSPGTSERPTHLEVPSLPRGADSVLGGGNLEDLLTIVSAV